MQGREHLGRRAAADRRRAQGVAGQRRDAGCARAFAADVADHEHRAVLVVVEHVVEVAAHLVQLAGGRVERLHLDAGDLRQRLRQQRPLQGVRDPGSLGVETRVLHGGAGAPAEPHGESEIGLRQASARTGGDERDRAQRPCRRGQRHDDHGGCLHLAQQLQMRAVARVGGEGIRLDVRVEARLPAADHLRHPPGIIRRGVVAAVEFFRQRDLARVGVMNGHAFDLPALAQYVDGAPVGDLRDGQARDLLQRLGVIHRGGEHAAGLGHEAFRQLCALDLGDVLEDVDGVVDARRLRVGDRRGADDQPALLSRRAHDVLHQQRLWMLTPEQSPCRHRLQIELVSLLGRRRESET